MLPHGAATPGWIIVSEEAMLGGADCWRKVRSDFSNSLSFPLISSHSGARAGFGADWTPECDKNYGREV